VSYFVEKIHHLDNKVQHHLKAIIETVLYSTDKGEMNGKALAKLLQDTGKSSRVCTAPGKPGKSWNFVF